MVISNPDEYRRAIAELHRRRKADPRSDSPYLRDLEAAIAAFGQQQASHEAKPGRPAGSIPTH